MDTAEKNRLSGIDSITTQIDLPFIDMHSGLSAGSSTTDSISIGDIDIDLSTFGGGDTIVLGDYTTTIGNGGSGSYTVSNGSGFNWSNTPLTVDHQGSLDLRGEHADININGISVMSTLKVIQDRLGMLVPNPQLEAEWDELRELGERYRELEKKCKEKSSVWNKLKQMPPPPLP